MQAAVLAGADLYGHHYRCWRCSSLSPGSQMPAVGASSGCQGRVPAMKAWVALPVVHLVSFRAEATGKTPTVEAAARMIGQKETAPT